MTTEQMMIAAETMDPDTFVEVWGEENEWIWLDVAGVIVDTDD